MKRKLFIAYFLLENSLDLVLALGILFCGKSFWFQTSLSEGGDVRIDAMRYNVTAPLGLSVL